MSLDNKDGTSMVSNHTKTRTDPRAQEHGLFAISQFDKIIASNSPQDATLLVVKRRRAPVL